MVDDSEKSTVPPPYDAEENMLKPDFCRHEVTLNASLNGNLSVSMVLKFSLSVVVWTYQPVRQHVGHHRRSDVVADNDASKCDTDQMASAPLIDRRSAAITTQQLVV